MWGAQGWNQWTVQPPAFDDVPHEQIDWAALAKQWIQMQQKSKPSEHAAAPVVLPLPEGQVSPAISKDLCLMEETSSNFVPVYETPVSSCEPFETERPNTHTAEDNSAVCVCAASDIDERSYLHGTLVGHSTWPTNIQGSSSVIPFSKETYDYGHDNNPKPLAIRSIEYNHGGSHSATRNLSYEIYNSQNCDYWSQVNASTSFLKKESTTLSPHEEESTSTQIDALKRKQLPQWIKDGLEKMEQERLKKRELEREKTAKERKEERDRFLCEKIELPPKENPSLLPEKSKFESDSEPEEERGTDTHTNKKSLAPVSRLMSHTPNLDLRNVDERKKEMILSMRRILTEILLSVTNTEIEDVAKEIFFKEKTEDSRAHQLASTVEETVVLPGLRGLVNYETESEATSEASDSDEDLYKKRHMCAVKERKNFADFQKRTERERVIDGCEALVKKNLNDFIKSPRNSYSNSSEISEKERNTPKQTDDDKKYHENLFSFTPPLSNISEKSIRIPLINDLDEGDIPINHGDNEETEVSREHDLKKDSSCNPPDSSSSSNSESESSNFRGHEFTTHIEHDKRDDTKKTELKSRARDTRDSSTEKQQQQQQEDITESERDKRNVYNTNKCQKSRERSKRVSDKKADYKRKKRNRSDSTDSTSSSGSTRRRHRSRSHLSDYRSGGNTHKRQRERSVSPRSYHNRHSKASSSYRHDRERSRHDRRYHDYKRSPSPYKRSYKSPKKYRSSRSPSSDNDSYGRKMKNSRYH